MSRSLGCVAACCWMPSMRYQSTVSSRICTTLSPVITARWSALFAAAAGAGGVSSAAAASSVTMANRTASTNLASIQKRSGPLGSAHCVPRSREKQAPAPLLATGARKPPNRWRGVRSLSSAGRQALVERLVLAGHIRVPVSEAALGVVFPRPHVQLVERIETVAVGRASRGS